MLNFENILIWGSVGCFLLLVNIVIVAMMVSGYRKMRAVNNWASTVGTVTVSTTEMRSSGSRRDSRTEYPVVKYTYRVNGQEYQSGSITAGFEVGGTGASKTAAKYPVGSQVTLFYNPTNPAQAVLEKKSVGLWILLLGLIVSNVIGCLVAAGITYFR